MTNKPKDPLKSLTVRVSEAEHRQLKQMALEGQDGVRTAQALVRRWIRLAWLKRQKAKGESWTRR